MKRRISGTGREPLELAEPARMAVIGIAAIAFGFSFIASGSPGSSATPAPEPSAEAIGAVDLADVSMDQETGTDQPPDEGLFYTVYRVVKGDTISEIADRYGVTTDAIVTFNAITNARTLSIGRYLKVPTINGILYESKAGDTASSIAAAYKISEERILEVNRLDGAPLEAGRPLFLPDARLSSWTLREISGDLFSWPIRGGISSWYGWRNDPFTGARSFHTGIDIGGYRGQPVKAAMEGVVSATGYSTTSGNYVVIRHHSGYSTLYGHLDRIDVKPGKSVTQATVIGAVGSTGYSTGPHLHFTVSKYGRTLNPMTVLR